MELVRPVVICALTMVLLACAPAPPAAPRSPAAAGPSAGPGPQRTLTIIARGEPPTIAARTITPFSGSLSYTARLFNATLDAVDEREQAVPYLAEALPQLNTPSWEVFPDGTMLTRYYLRPRLTWHDGQPLAAEDFVFGWRVYRTPEFIGAAGSAVVSAMAEVRAPDAATVEIFWGRPYPDAAAMDLSFQALPRHLLEQPFRELDAQAFASLPFWTSDYIGLAPTGSTSGASARPSMRAPLQAMRSGAPRSTGCM